MIKKIISITVFSILVLMFSIGIASGEEKVVLTLAGQSPKEGLTEVFVNYFIDAVTSKTNGEIQIDDYFGGVLGPDDAERELLKIGEIDMSIDQPHIDKWFPEYDATTVPFLFPNPEAIRYYYEDPFIAEIIAERMLENGNCVMVTPLIARGRRYTSSNKPLRKYEDFKGLKMRLPTIQIWIDVWEALGVVAVPIGGSEVFSALQTGVVEAQENILDNILGRHLYEVQDYLIATKHIEYMSQLIMNNDSFESLSSDHQKILLESAAEGSSYVLSNLEEVNQKTIQSLQDNGMELIELDLDEILDKLWPDIERIAKEKFAPGVMEAAQRAIDKSLEE